MKMKILIYSKLNLLSEKRYNRYRKISSDSQQWAEIYLIFSNFHNVEGMFCLQP